LPLAPGNGRFGAYYWFTGSESFHHLLQAMTRTDCPLYGDLTKLNDGALEFAFDLCRRRQHLPEYAEAFKLIQEEDAYRWNNGGKAKFQAMLIREFGDRAIQL
jgi:hypothetical protein